MPTTIGNITVHLGPIEQGGPDSLLAPIVNFIDRAKKRQKLMIAVQEIDNPDIANAIIRARQRGAIVDVVIEQDYLLAEKAKQDPFEPGGKHEINRILYNAFLRAKVDVKSDYNPHIFHQKFMVLGDKVLTGSTNFTSTGVAKNLNHVVEINNKGIANAYKKEFREIQKGRFGKNSVDRDEIPKEAEVSNVRVKAAFAPDHAPEMEIMKQILKAKSRIDFAIFTFSKSSGIDDALIAAADRNVAVTGIIDNQVANQKWAATKPLMDNGIKLKKAGKIGTLGKLHHKLMVIDDSVTIIGSFNYTGPANKSNDENIMVIGDVEETNQTAIDNQGIIGVACRDEIQRIYNELGKII